MLSSLSYLLSLLVLVLSIVELEAENRYVFYPKDGRNQHGAGIITRDLRAFVDNPSTLYISTSDYIGTFYWTADMTDSQASEFERSHQDLVYFPYASLS